MRELTGTTRLLRLAVRRDRVLAPVWLLAILGAVLATVHSYQRLYPEAADLEAVRAEVTASPSLIALSGPPFDLLNLGGLTAWKVGGFVAVLAGVLNVLLVVRHTRAEEEAGRLELLRAGVVGRDAALAAALGLALTLDLAMAGLIALGCVGLGLAGPGALVLGLSTGLAGAGLAAVAALAAQLTRSARTADAIGFAVLAAGFVLRAVGDSTGPGWLSWLSPVGWAQQARPYAGERWWVLLLPMAVTPAVLAAAVTLSHRRDLGEAPLAEPGGPARGSIGGTLALTWRLQRVTLAIWLAGFVVVGALVGGITPGLGAMVRDNQQLVDVLARLGGTQGVTDAFTAATIRIAGLVTAVYAVAAVLRLRSEESAGLAEPMLATAVGRLRWAGSQLGLALAGSALMLAGFGLAAGAGAALAGPATASALLDPLAGSLLQLPAVWVTAGTAVALFGLLPRLSALAWGLLGVVLAISWLGPLLQAGPGLLDVSPFTHVPSIPGDRMAWTPELWLAAAAGVLCGAGLLGWRRRDVG